MPTKATFADLEQVSSLRPMRSETVGYEGVSGDSFLGGSRNIKKTRTGFSVEVPAQDLDDVEKFNDQWNYYLDPQIKDLQRKMIPRTAVNKAFLTYNDETAMMTMNSIANAIRGKGTVVETKDVTVRFLLEAFFDNMNGAQLIQERYSIADLIRDIIIDNSIFGEALFMKRVFHDRLSVHRLDPKTLYPVSHELAGWRKYIQRTYIGINLPGVVPASSEELQHSTNARGFPAARFVDTEEEIEAARKLFYSKDFEPPAPVWHADRRVVDKVFPHSIHIPDYKMYIFNLYRRSLVDPILEILLYKRFMLFYLRKAAEKFAGPLLIFTVGTADAHPTNKTSYESLLDKYAFMGASTRFGDSLAVPWNVKVNPIDVAGRTVDITAQLEFVNKTIVQALGSSMALYDARGVELATSSTIQEVWLRNIAGHRDKLQGMIQQIGLDYLTTCEDDYPGISRKEFKVTWAPLQKEERDRYIRALLDLWNAGILNDKYEVRRLIKSAGILDLTIENIPEDDDEEDNLKNPNPLELNKEIQDKIATGAEGLKPITPTRLTRRRPVSRSTGGGFGAERGRSSIRNFQITDELLKELQVFYDQILDPLLQKEDNSQTQTGDQE